MHLAPAPSLLRATGFALIGSIAMVLSVGARADTPDLPAWWPAALPLPHDSRIGSVREVGSQIRMLTLRTDHPADDLLHLWSDSLEAAGYSVDWNIHPGGPARFAFEGPQVLNGQVVSTPCDEGCVTRLQIDMTLK